MSIVFVSGHYPASTPFAMATRRSFEDYAARHGYGHYYDDSLPETTETHELHYRRCLSLNAAARKFPGARWFVWTDSDVFVNKPDCRVESLIDLSDHTYMYHLFHEDAWPFPINTGVKFVNRDALPIELEIHGLRNTAEGKMFPFEQRAMFHHVLPRIPGRYKIHDPYVLNHILYQSNCNYTHSHHDALFIHICGRSTSQRNKVMEILEKEKRVLTKSEIDSA